MKYAAPLFLVILLFTFSMQAQAALEVIDGKVTADLQAEQLGAVIQQIAEQAGLHSSVDASAANELVYANFKGLSVGAAIRKLLEGTDINYAVIGDGQGTPKAIYVSRSEAPGAPPKRLDTRPVTAMPTRGVVTPVQPPPPIQQPVTQPNVAGPRGQQSLDQKPNAQPGNPNNSNTVPTAGSFSGSPPVQPQQQQQLNRPDMKPEVINDDSGDDDDDEDDE